MQKISSKTATLKRTVVLNMAFIFTFWPETSCEEHKRTDDEKWNLVGTKKATNETESWKTCRQNVPEKDLAFFAASFIIRKVL